MSLVIAVKDGDKIIVGSDNQTTESNKIKLPYKKDYACKVRVMKEKGIIVASTGLASSSNITSCRSDLYEEFPQDELTKEYLVTKYVPKLKKILADEKVVDNPEYKKGCYDIIAFKDKMYYITSNYDVLSINNFIADGVGDEIATTIYENSNLCSRDKILEALRYVSRNFASVGGHFTLVDTKNLEYEFVEE